MLPCCLLRFLFFFTNSSTTEIYTLFLHDALPILRVISMEVTRDEHLDEIREALRQTGDATGVMLQIGTRNTQNFELLKAVGSQRDFPILLKRGFGITLHESLLAAEYVANAANRDIVV